MTYITLETKREGYSIDQCSGTMKVRELICYLEQFDEESEIYFSNDNGYTYGSLKSWQINECYEDSEEEEE